MAFIATATNEANNMDHIDDIIKLIQLNPSSPRIRPLLESLYRLGVIEGNLQTIREMRPTRDSGGSHGSQ